MQGPATGNNKETKNEKKDKAPTFPIDLLSTFASGILTANVSGIPLLKIDAESRSVGVEATGVKECGIRLSKIVRLPKGGGGVVEFVKSSESAARELSENGWELSLYDRGSRIVSIGRGASKLTGYVNINPLKLGRLLKIL
ncbi:MAG TPA: hypothetical protein VFF30_01290 [Nitrososphaerales archaeon]|nr:hypothetical protein [Nitrososphaerales archaeon]